MSLPLGDQAGLEVLAPTVASRCSVRRSSPTTSMKCGEEYVRSALKASRLPSGDQAGDSASTILSELSRRLLVPFGRTR
jgi:hypothetical protein